MPKSAAKKDEDEKVFSSFRKIGCKCCPYCGDHEVYRSRIEPLTWLDRACLLSLCELVRCHECEVRHYRPIFFPAPEYSYRIGAREKRTQAHATDQKRKRSA